MHRVFDGRDHCRLQVQIAIDTIEQSGDRELRRAPNPPLPIENDGCDRNAGKTQPSARGYHPASDWQQPAAFDRITADGYMVDDFGWSGIEA